MFDRFEEDEKRIRQRPKTVVLSDGREYTHKQIFDTFMESKLEKDYMKEALYRILTDKPLTVELSTREVGETIDFESLIRRKKIDRSKTEEAKFTVNGVDSNSPNFFNELEKTGVHVLI